MDSVAISLLRIMPPGAFDPLAEEAEAEGWQFVRRLAEEWYDGTNRFDRPGETLFGAWAAGTLVGVCGLNVDPYVGDPSVGRVRRLFVTSSVSRPRCGSVPGASRGRSSCGEFPLRSE